MALQRVRTPILEIAYEESGPASGLPVILLHGWPFDVRAFDEVIPHLASAGLRVIAPYLRGFGPTRFLSASTIRSGEQAALGKDLLDLLDALKIDKALLAGFDWGGRAACVVSALWPDRVHGLVTCTGYQIQDIAGSIKPADPEQERRFWYQYYFHTERGRNGLTQMRTKIANLLWRLWSPKWQFDDATFARTAASFENPDFVEITVHSYRHRAANAPSDPSYAPVESRLSKLPQISVPTIVIHGEVDDVNPPDKSLEHHKHFTGPYERRVFENVGHNPPQEAPKSFADAILALVTGDSDSTKR
jgi:pimeloyl-ACP methyl ester carboxylesterase